MQCSGANINRQLKLSRFLPEQEPHLPFAPLMRREAGCTPSFSAKCSTLLCSVCRQPDDTAARRCSLTAARHPPAEKRPFAASRAPSLGSSASEASDRTVEIARPKGKSSPLPLLLLQSFLMLFNPALLFFDKGFDAVYRQPLGCAHDYTSILLQLDRHRLSIGTNQFVVHFSPFPPIFLHTKLPNRWRNYALSSNLSQKAQKLIVNLLTIWAAWL